MFISVINVNIIFMVSFDYMFIVLNAIYIYIRTYVCLYENIMRVNTNDHETWIEFYWIMVY